MQNIDKLSKEYMRQELMLTAAVFLVALMVMQVWLLDLLTPIIIGTCFTFVVFVTIGLVWRRVAKSSPESLPTFFTAVSGFRMLLALAVMFVYYLVALAGQPGIGGFRGVNSPRRTYPALTGLSHTLTGLKFRAYPGAFLSTHLRS